MVRICTGRRPARRCRKGMVASPEGLESRSLLATTAYTFVPPDLSGPFHHGNPTAAIFDRLVGSLQAQITLGPLADLRDAKGAPNPPRINGDQFVEAVANMAQGFEAAAAQAAPNNPLL